jgi:hypothetical protein
MGQGDNSLAFINSIGGNTINKITKAKEFSVWIDLSDTSGDSISIDKGEVNYIYNKGSHPLKGFARYNNTGSNHPIISEKLFNGNKYLSVPQASHRYRAIGEDTFDSSILTKLSNRHIFSSAVTMILKPSANDGNKMLLAFGGLKFSIPLAGSSFYFDMFDTSRRILANYSALDLEDKWVIISGFYTVKQGVVDAGLRTNGSASPTTSISNTTTEATVNRSVWEFLNDSDGTGTWDGSLGEIMLYSPNDISDVEKAEGYLAHKWGMSASLPLSHPYKSSSPINYPSQVSDSSLVRAPYTTNNLFLDNNNYPEAYALYSMRLLTNKWTGACLRLQRSSDSKEVDLRFDPITNQIDLSRTYYVGTTDEFVGQSASAFVGSGDGLVSVWYDQSGNLKHTISDGHIFPKLYRGGVLQTINGRPCVDFSSVGEGFKTGLLFNRAINSTGYSVLNRQKLGAIKRRTISSQTDNEFYFTYNNRMSGGSTPIVYWLTPNSSIGVAATSDIKNHGVSHSSTNLQMYVDGALCGSSFANPNTSQPVSFNFNRWDNGVYDSESSDVRHQELLIFVKSIDATQHNTWHNSVNTDFS